MTVDERTSDPSGETKSTDDVVRLDWTGFDEPSSGIVEAVARATDLRPTELPPLHRTVETDALNVLLSSDGADVGAPLRVSFRYAGRLVTVSATGDVVVRP